MQEYAATGMAKLAYYFFDFCLATHRKLPSFLFRDVQKVHDNPIFCQERCYIHPLFFAIGIVLSISYISTLIKHKTTL
jgi:hypothetical protein